MVFNWTSAVLESVSTPVSANSGVRMSFSTRESMDSQGCSSAKWIGWSSSWLPLIDLTEHSYSTKAVSGLQMNTTSDTFAPANAGTCMVELFFSEVTESVELKTLSSTLYVKTMTGKSLMLIHSEPHDSSYKIN